MVKAVVLGASGGIGQPLSLLCKISTLIDEVSIFDVVNTLGVAADLSHISTKAKLEGYVAAKGDMGCKTEESQQAQEKTLSGADVVIIPAGVPRKPGMSREDLFKINGGIVAGLVEACAKYCPKAYILVISNPVNSTVPIAVEVMKKHGVLDPKKIFGVTTLDVVRAETFIGELSGQRTDKVVVPVVGGHSGKTIVPLFSQAKPAVNIPADKLDALTNRVQFGGDEVVAAKDGAGSATLSMAYAGFRFAEALIKAVQGEKNVIEPAFVYLPGVPGGEEIQKATGCDYFSVPIQLGPNGVEKAINILPEINDYEKKLVAECTELLKPNIATGADFITKAGSKL